MEYADRGEEQKQTEQENATLASIRAVTSNGVIHGLFIGPREAIASHLLMHFGLISGRPGPEDSQGRATLALLEPKEVVSRCFALADEFIAQSGAQPVTLEQWEAWSRLQSHIESMKYDHAISSLRRKTA